MKQLLLAFSALLFSAALHGQCTPDPQFEDEDFGVWPDTATGFATGQVDQVYEQIINIKLPENAGAIDPNFSLFQVDSATLLGISGLPPGLEYDCLSQTGSLCTILGGGLSCGTIFGTPTQAGTYPLTIESIVYVKFLGQTTASPFNFEDYEIVVEDVNSVGQVSASPLAIVGVAPNPAVNQTRIAFTSDRSRALRLEVFDLLGKQVAARTVRASAGENSVELPLAGFDSGLYVFRLTGDGITRQGRFVVR